MSAAERLDLEETTPTSMSARPRHERAGLQVLEGTSKRRGILTLLPFLGPAFVASVAYMDPGNFATNISAGAQFGYKLLWVVVVSNLIAMLIQHLSAKLGIATGRSLPEAIRERWPTWAIVVILIAAEVAAMATDLAEFLGAALGLNLLFHVPLFLAALLVGAATFAILGLQKIGLRPIESIIGSLVALIAGCYLVETFLVRPDWGQVASHSVHPYISSGSILVSVGILGATVMPHVVYLHSSLTQTRIRAGSDEQKRRLLRYNMVDVVIAMSVAGLINMAMLYMAAATFHKHGFTSVADLRSAYHTLTPLLGSFASIVFGVSLLASGLASSAVGTMAGQSIMAGFVRRTVPVWLWRGITMAPALVIIALNVPSTQALVISQVILSLTLPFAIVPLVRFTADRSFMGALVNFRITTVLAGLATVAVLGLNGLLIYQTVGGSL